MFSEITKYPRPSESNEYTQCPEITKYPQPFPKSQSTRNASQNHKVPEMRPISQEAPNMVPNIPTIPKELDHIITNSKIFRRKRR